MTDFQTIADTLSRQHTEVTYTFSQKEDAITWLHNALRTLFPQIPTAKQHDRLQLQATLEQHSIKLRMMLDELGVPGAEGLASDFIGFLPAIKEGLLLDLDAIFLGDPAAKSKEEVVLTYPGFTAIAIYRIAHFFYRSRIHLLPRIFSERAHELTGIDIHPGASIGKSFCIDHGTGIVIGETSTIGHRVKIYQGVTLGALSVKKELSDTKRHPTVEDDVVIYANTTILGGQTVIGKGSVIGGNVWLTESVPPHSTVYRKVEVEVKTKGNG